MSRKILPGILGIAALILVIGCIWQTLTGKNQNKMAEKQLFAMDTYMKFTAYGNRAEEAVEAAAEEVIRLDALLSTGSDSSEISILNNSGSNTVSEDTRILLERSEEIYKKTDHLFDISIYPLMELWGFSTGEYKVPEQAEIDALLPLVSAQEIRLQGDTVTLKEGQKIDLGAIAKGYTSHRLMEIYKEYGIKSGMVYLGGNVQTLGAKPDGTAWNIGIQNPVGNQGTAAFSVAVKDKAVITSGGYERYFEQNGKRYIHILDPETGYPVENDLISVTVLSADGALADALSTSLFIMGKERAEEFWKNSTDVFEMILFTNDGKIYVTENLIPDLHITGTYEILKKGKR